MQCNLCGKEFANKRAMHGHLIRVHEDEYKKSGNDDALFYSVDVVADAQSPRPYGFRLINLSARAEHMAYGAGYRYIDGADNVYTFDEVTEMGWI